MTTTDLREDFQNQVNRGFSNMSWAADGHPKTTPQQQFPQPSMMGQMNHSLNQNSAPRQPERYDPAPKNLDHRLQPPNQNPILNNPTSGTEIIPFYKNKKVLALFLVVAIILAVGGYFLYRYCKKPKDGDDDDDEKLELEKFRKMMGMRTGAPEHFPNPPQMNNVGPVPPPMAHQQMPGAHLQQPQPQPHYQQPQQQQQPEQQRRREQQHGPPPASSGFPQAGASPIGRVPQGASDDSDPMFTKLSDLP